VITGLAPAHLNHYPNLDAAGKDIFSLADHLKDKNIYVNGESDAIDKYIKPGHHVYSYEEVGEHKITHVEVDYTGTSFTLEYKGKKLKLKSELLGRHQVGPLAAVATIALSLGLTPKQVEEGIARTVSFEHRMQPRVLGGAWIIDDTYNGNIDGIRAGLSLLKELPAERKIYITPGLVDQGVETQAVHETMGRLIAEANPTKVVLMNNSVSAIIEKAIKETGYKGEVKIEYDPLNFYTNLEQFVAAGDLVLMQNDWPDNYY
jgi:UDP-N-acetylmuramoyl-tripeptide--D-alanyl-D-alanine ligase